MDRFYIITNDAKDRDFKLTEEIETYLTSHGKECRVQQAERRQRGKFHYTDPDLIPEGTQCILVPVSYTHLKKYVPSGFCPEKGICKG